jgi:hypothetical protein
MNQEEFPVLQRFVVQIKPPNINTYSDISNNADYRTLTECIDALNSIKNKYPEDYCFRILKIECHFNVIT